MLPQFPLLGPAISTGPLFRRPGHVYQSKVYSALREKLTFRTLFCRVPALMPICRKF
jgi:hypothetical protein